METLLGVAVIAVVLLLGLLIWAAKALINAEAGEVVANHRLKEQSDANEKYRKAADIAAEPKARDAAELSKRFSEL